MNIKSIQTEMCMIHLFTYCLTQIQRTAYYELFYMSNIYLHCDIFFIHNTHHLVLRNPKLNNKLKTNSHLLCKAIKKLLINHFL